MESKNFAEKVHKSVMLSEAIEYLDIKPDGFYIDCTLGEGGHSFEIWSRLAGSEKGLLISLDADKEAIEFVKKNYEPKPNWIIKNENFSKLKTIAESYKREVDGILMDLGISSRQLEVSDRGFSYLEGKQNLDMRMDTELGVTAADLINVLNTKQLELLFYKYGEERFAKSIAQAIKSSPSRIETVDDLLTLIYRAMPTAHRYGSKHPARKVFQALRIAVNSELENLKTGLDDGINLLGPKGRLVVISFHSLEDRIVKEIFENAEVTGLGEIITKKPVLPIPSEINLNKRSHSAKLRCFEKKTDPA